MTAATPTLVGDGIENPHNARVLRDAAAMFGVVYRFRDRAGLAEVWSSVERADEPLPLIDRDALAAEYRPLMALENAPGAASLFGFRPPPGPRPALVVGNERRGVAADLRALAACAVQIPMARRGVNTLNVASAAAVALYQLARPSGAMRTHAQPERRRPELLLVGGDQQAELGSALRSAAAFGWQRLLLDDRERVWFGASRSVQAEGRAAARRHHNAIRVIPLAPAAAYGFDEVCVVTMRERGTPLGRAGLARGPRQLIVIPDESRVDVEAKHWDRLGRSVRFVSLALPVSEFPYHYRLTASIALAEVFRQVGKAMPRASGTRRPPPYRRGLTLGPPDEGHLVPWECLREY